MNSDLPLLMKKVLMTFVVVSVVLFLVTFGSFCLGKYAFSLNANADLWWPLYHFATLSASGGVVAAVVVYYGGKRKAK